MRSVTEVDVAIVGGGIAGPALACALADSGRRVVLIERSDEPLDTARGDHLQPKTCEWLSDWGVLDACFALGAERRLGSLYLTPDGDSVFHAQVDSLDIPFPHYLYLNHELISQALLEGAARNPQFTLLRPALARPLPDESRFSVEVETQSGTQEIKAALVVAADGRASRFRKAAGIAADTYAYQNPMLTMFAQRTLDDERNDVRAYFTEAGILSVIPRTNGQWKVGIPVPPSELAALKRATVPELGRLLSTWAPELAGIQPEICGVYPITSMNAERWSTHNLLLLGDACNTLHPGRSQGMNIALRAVQRLVRLLSDDEVPLSAAGVRDTLARFEQEMRPPMERRLADNHQRGLEMDRRDPAEVNAMRERLELLGQDEAAARAYCLQAAGY